jgi:hypothetical protein
MPSHSSPRTQAKGGVSLPTALRALPPLWPGWSGLRFLALTCADCTAGRKAGFSPRARARGQPLDKVLGKSRNSAFRGFLPHVGVRLPAAHGERLAPTWAMSGRVVVSRGLAPLWPGLVRVTLSCGNMRGLYGWSKNRDLARARARACCTP